MIHYLEPGVSTNRYYITAVKNSLQAKANAARQDISIRTSEGKAVAVVKWYDDTPVTTTPLED